MTEIGVDLEEVRSIARRVDRTVDLLKTPGLGSPDGAGSQAVSEALSAFTPLFSAEMTTDREEIARLVDLILMAANDFSDTDVNGAETFDTLSRLVGDADGD